MTGRRSLLAMAGGDPLGLHPAAPPETPAEEIADEVKADVAAVAGPEAAAEVEQKVAEVEAAEAAGEGPPAEKPAAKKPPRKRAPRKAPEPEPEPEPEEPKRPLYELLLPKQARLTPRQWDGLRDLEARINREGRWRRTPDDARITTNTLIRIAVDLLLADDVAGKLHGVNENELRKAVGLDELEAIQ